MGQHGVEQLPRFTLVTVNGGEIFVRSDLREILTIILAKHQCHLYTNGTCITPEIASDLVDMGVTSMGISVDGPEKVHDSIRGRGSSGRTIESIRLLTDLKRRRRKKFPLLNLKTTITDKNVCHLSEMVQFAERLGLEYCTFQVLNNSIHMGGVSFQSDALAFSRAFCNANKIVPAKSPIMAITTNNSINVNPEAFLWRKFIFISNCNLKIFECYLITLPDGKNYEPSTLQFNG